MDEANQRISLIWELWNSLLANVQPSVFGYLGIFLAACLVVIAFLLFLENRHPLETWSWLLTFGSFPLVGIILYLLLGQNYHKGKFFRGKYFLDRQTFITNDNRNILNIEEVGNRYVKCMKLAERIGNVPVSFYTETRVLTNGDETFSHMFEELKKAKHHIHLEYYIVRNDRIGQRLKELLILKAKEGVKVRFLYDAFGSRKLPRSYIQELRESGVEIAVFGPLGLPFLNRTFNYRNHRKIVIIDAAIGFLGGLNVGDEYLGHDASHGFWRDTHLLVKGEAVETLQVIFLQDWYYSTNQSYLTDDYLFNRDQETEMTGGIQIIAGGPDCAWSNVKTLLFSMITSATESIWIASPYFIPDEDIFEALKVAALSGLDVRLLVPQRPDKRIVFHASRTYFSDLLNAGVRIFEYGKGFMHSKVVIVDKELASIGTANMDMRSFHLNFEVNAILYQTESAGKLTHGFLEDIHVSVEIQEEAFVRRHIGLRLWESICRLLSPLL